MKSEYDVTTFIKRYLALEDEEPVLTDAGNLQPALYDVRFAHDDEESVTPNLPAAFYRACNHAFRKLSRDLVVFPSSMFGHEEICVMSRSTFLGIIDKSVTDDQAQLPLDDATSMGALDSIVQDLKRNAKESQNGQ